MNATADKWLVTPVIEPLLWRATCHGARVAWDTTKKDATGSYKGCYRSYNCGWGLAVRSRSKILGWVGKAWFHPNWNGTKGRRVRACLSRSA